MKNTPTLFGFPLWYGKIKARRAKKFLNRMISSPLWFAKNIKHFRNMDVGGVVNTCDGFNHKIHDLYPDYIQVGSGHVLVDVNLIINEHGATCSLTHCGVVLPKDRDYIESSYANFVEGWLFGGPGAIWYEGLDNPKYQTEIKRITNRHETIKSGGHICDEQGFLLEEFR